MYVLALAQSVTRSHTILYSVSAENVRLCTKNKKQMEKTRGANWTAFTTGHRSGQRDLVSRCFASQRIKKPTQQRENGTKTGRGRGKSPTQKKSAPYKAKKKYEGKTERWRVKIKSPAMTILRIEGTRNMREWKSVEGQHHEKRNIGVLFWGVAAISLFTQHAANLIG